MAVIAGTTDADIKGRAVNYMTNGALAGATPEMVTITRNVTLTGTDTGTQITINYPFEFMVLNPVVRLIHSTSTVGAPITMQSNALMRNEM